jgi:hypothetical protein
MDMDADEMRRRANRYRHIASTITDARAIKALNDLADEYEAQATQGIWVGRPAWPLTNH